MSDKEKKLKEFRLRRLIRKAIRIKESKEKAIKLQEEEKLRKIIRHVIINEEVDSDTTPAPYESTPMNILADVLDQALPVLKTGLRKLAKPEERRSFRRHVLEKFVNLFNTIESLDVQGKAIGETDLNEDEDIDVKIKVPDDMVVPPSEKYRFKEKEKSTEEKEEESFKKFAKEGENPTGARAAFETFGNSNIASIIANKRKVLHDDEDKQQFKKYCLYNIDLWLITYEDEISDELGQESAFTNPIIKKPSGAKVSAEKVTGAGPEEGNEIPDIEADQDLSADDFEDELEKLLMMERDYVGK